MGLIIWLDRQQAKVFQMQPTGIRKLKIQRSGFRKPVETLGRNHPIKQTDEEKFYHYTCKFIEEMNDPHWFLSGPGVACDHLINHIKMHHPHLEKNIQCVQKMDYLTDAQIVDHGIKFFKHAHLFEELEYAASPRLTDVQNLGVV